MFEECVLTLVPIIALAADVICQVVIFRFRIVPSLLKSIYFGFLLGLTTLTAVHWLMSPDFFASMDVLALNLLSFGFLAYGYFHFINLGETARRVRLLREIYLSDGLSQIEILSRYGARHMVEVRLGRLIRNQQIKKSGPKLVIARKSVLRMANIMVFIKWLLLQK